MVSRLGYRPGDLVPHLESLEYCTVTAKIRNGDDSAVTLNRDNIVGHPLKAGASGADFTLALDGDEDDVIALLMDGPGEEIGATSNSVGKYQVLKNPPAVINSDVIQTVDSAEDAFDVGAIVTALKALGFEVRTLPAKRSGG